MSRLILLQICINRRLDNKYGREGAYDHDVGV